MKFCETKKCRVVTNPRRLPRELFYKIVWLAENRKLESLVGNPSVPGWGPQVDVRQDLILLNYYAIGHSSPGE